MEKEKEENTRERNIIGDANLPTNQATGEYKAICPFEKKAEICN